MELLSRKYNFYSKRQKKELHVFLFVYLQLINLVTGPDIFLKFLGYQYENVADIGFGWFTTSINFIFILLSVLVLLKNYNKSRAIILKSKMTVYILLLTLFSSFLVIDDMFDQSLNLIFLTIGYFVKVWSLIVLFDNYNIGFFATLLKTLKILVLLILLYFVAFPSNGFSIILPGRYQSIFSQPNTLGQFSSLTIAALFAERLFFCKKNIQARKNISFFFFLILSVALVVFSQSFTNFLLILLVLITYFFYDLRDRILKLLVLVSVILFSFFYATNSRNLSFLSVTDSSSFSSSFSRDLTLTGRTEIWRDVFDKASLDNKSYLAYGLGGFWGKMGAPSSKIENQLFLEIGQSHNGLIDLFVQYGIIGIVIFVYFLITILNKLLKKESSLPEIIFFNFFFILFIFNNLVESSYLQPKNFLNAIFILGTIYILNSKYLMRSKIKKYYKKMILEDDK